MMVYQAFGRLIGPIVVAVLQWYSRVTHQPRVRVIIVNEQNEVLLVRNWAGTPFLELPGGGIERGEQPIDAAKRELHEETGILVEDLMDIGSVTLRYEARLFLGRAQKTQLPTVKYNRWEIIEIGWHAIATLPKDVSPLVLVALQKVPK